MDIDDPIFDYYLEYPKDFNSFVKRHKDAMLKLLMNGISFAPAICRGEKCKVSDIPRDILFSVTEMVVILAGMRGGNNELRRGLKDLSEGIFDVRKNKFEEDTAEISKNNHWENVGQYCFLIVYRLHLMDKLKDL